MGELDRWSHKDIEVNGIDGSRLPEVEEMLNRLAEVNKERLEIIEKIERYGE